VAPDGDSVTLLPLRVATDTNENMQAGRQRAAKYRCLATGTLIALQWVQDPAQLQVAEGCI
jgi:hypothetical protein